MLRTPFLHNYQPDPAPSSEVAFDVIFQPILNTCTKEIFGYEALTRCKQELNAKAVLERLNKTNEYQFDRELRVRAIDMMQSMRLKGVLNINLLPNRQYLTQQEIDETLELANYAQIPPSDIMFEMTKGERLENIYCYQELFKLFKKNHFMTAIDHFGAGYASLKAIKLLEPDVIKLDRSLVKDIDYDERRQAVVEAIVHMCKSLDVVVIAKGVETIAEQKTLSAIGIELFQGFLFLCSNNSTDDIFSSLLEQSESAGCQEG